MLVLDGFGNQVEIPSASGIMPKAITTEWGKPVEPILECHTWPDVVVSQTGSDIILLIYIDVCYFWGRKVYFPLPSEKLISAIKKSFLSETTQELNKLDCERITVEMRMRDAPKEEMITLEKALSSIEDKIICLVDEIQSRR